MSGIHKFEDLECWKLARELVRLVYSVTDHGKLSKDFAARDQVRKAALSVMNNIAEGFSKHSNKDFIRFLDIAQASSMEVKSMAYVFEDLSYLFSADAQTIRTSADKIRLHVLSLIKYLRNHSQQTQNIHGH